MLPARMGKHSQSDLICDLIKSRLVECFVLALQVSSHQCLQHSSAAAYLVAAGSSARKTKPGDH